MGKGQNVENHFVESQKKNIESLKFEKDQNVKSQIRLSTFWSFDVLKVQNVERSESRKFEKDQNVESLICLIFRFWKSVNYLWRKYLWCFGVKKSILKSFLTCLNLT